MKKLIGIFGLSMVFASSALAAPTEGTAAIGLGGGVHVTPDEPTVDVSGTYMTFIKDGIAVSGGADLGLVGPDGFSLGVRVGASYWMGLNDNMDGFAGIDLGLPAVTSGLTLGTNINLGVAYWLSDNYAMTLTNVLGLGDDILSEVAISDEIVLGVVSFF